MTSDIIRHWRDIEDAGTATYPGSDETFGRSASFAKHFGLRRLGIHHERIPPGHRSSWPHAEADEEEFVFVVEGSPDLWCDGRLYRLKEGDGVGFVPGTGMAHVFINNTEKDVRLLVVGEASRESSRIHYPMHPARNREIGDRWWSDVPARDQGPHDGMPDRKGEAKAD
jgi:uncharacterized cupin superfamily protein